MTKEIVPFWEASYKDKSCITFSGKPNPTLKEFEKMLDKNSKIIEVGCGEGQNVLYLAQQGYKNVEAFDISKHGIEKLNKFCKLMDVKIETFVADLITYKFEKSYNLIMSFGTLHFVTREEWKAFIAKAKNNTSIGGIHIMQIFTDKVPASEDIALFAVGLAKDGEIKELYNDWKILQFKSYVFEDEHPDVPKHLHSSNKIVAQRIR